MKLLTNIYSLFLAAIESIQRPVGFSKIYKPRSVGKTLCNPSYVSAQVSLMPIRSKNKLNRVSQKKRRLKRRQKGK